MFGSKKTKKHIHLLLYKWIGTLYIIVILWTFIQKKCMQNHVHWKKLHTLWMSYAQWVNTGIKCFLKPAVFILHRCYCEYGRRATFPERIWCKHYKSPLATNKSFERVWDRQTFPHDIQKAESGAEEKSQLFRKWLHMVPNKSCKLKFC